MRSLFLVECCFSLNMHFLKSLLQFQIFIIQIQKYLLFKYLVSNAFFIHLCHVKAVQDDISTKTVLILGARFSCFALFASNLPGNISMAACPITSDTLTKLRHLQNTNFYMGKNNFATFIDEPSVLDLFSFRMVIYHFRSMPTTSQSV